MKKLLSRVPRKHTDVAQLAFVAGLMAACILLGNALLLGVPNSALPAFLSGVHDLQADADRVYAACSGKPSKMTCYDQEIPKLMDQGLSMEDSFQVTRLVQAKDGGYYYCHVLAHKLAAKETAKDPDNWAGVIARCPVGMCSNGCLHGGFQERFRDDVLTAPEIDALIPKLMSICEPGNGRDFTKLEQASCYHALGHLSMYITGANAAAATGICDRVAKQNSRDFSTVCYEGAYMQIFQPLEPEDFTLVANIPATTTALAETFCDTYTGEFRAACHRESWPLYRAQLQKADGLVSFCGLVREPADLQRCYNAMFYVLTAQWNFNQAKITALCDGLPEERKGQCYANSASRFLETDYRLTPKAIELCEAAAKDGAGDACFGELLFNSAYNFKFGSPAFNQLCAALPEPWGTRCKEGKGAVVHQSGAAAKPYTSDTR